LASIRGGRLAEKTGDARISASDARDQESAEIGRRFNVCRRATDTGKFTELGKEAASGLWAGVRPGALRGKGEGGRGLGGTS
jgi:hypothetical protein